MIQRLQQGIRALATGAQPTDAAQAAIEGAMPAGPPPPADATAKASQDGLLAVGAVLGVSADEIKAGPDALLSAARDARLSGPLARATAKAGVDHDLAVALFTQSGKLAALDLSGDVGGQLAEAIGHVKVDHPAIRIQSMPVSSIAPMPAGSSSSPVLNRDVLAMMNPADLEAARRAGLIPGVTSK